MVKNIFPFLVILVLTFILYKDTLNSDSKLLYGFLLDRLSLSIKNNWHDENGNVYLIFTRKEVQDKLSLSDKTVTKAFKQLSDVNLIYEKKQGFSKPKLIYVAKIQHQKIELSHNRKNYDYINGDSTINESENLRSINTNNNYTDKTNKSGKKSNSYIGRKYTKDFFNSLYANKGFSV